MDDPERSAGGLTGDRAPVAGPRGGPVGPPAPSGNIPASVDEYEPAEGRTAFVRPYVLTGGRTRSSLELSIETLVSAAPNAARVGLSGEQDAFLGLCREPRSVAELAALSRMPLGVARVLIGDLAAAGVVAVHRTVGADGPDLALMQRVLSGLRKL